MKELVVYLARGLARRPEEVAVRGGGGENGALTMELTVAEEDLNQIIGKQGRTIKAMRTLLAAAAAKQGRRAFLKIKETGEDLRPEPEGPRPAEAFEPTPTPEETEHD